MKHIGFPTNLIRAIGCLACILAVQALVVTVQSAGAQPRRRHAQDHQLRWRRLERRTSPRTLRLGQSEGSRQTDHVLCRHDARRRNGCLGKAWADVSDPFTWHEDANNPLLKPDPKRACEGGSLRMDSVIYDKCAMNIGFTTLAVWATASIWRPAQRAKMVIATSRPPISSDTRTTRFFLRKERDATTETACRRERSSAKMVCGTCSMRTGARKSLQGIRLATSPDGKHWTKIVGPDLIRAAPEQAAIEWHQVYKIGKTYVLLYEGYNGGARWGPDFATSSSLTKGWKKAPTQLVDQTKWPNYSDKTMFHVATPAIYKINAKWHMFFQAAPAGEYMSQHWACGASSATTVLRNWPPRSETWRQTGGINAIRDENAGLGHDRFGNPHCPLADRNGPEAPARASRSSRSRLTRPRWRSNRWPAACWPKCGRRRMTRSRSDRSLRSWRSRDRRPPLRRPAVLSARGSGRSGAAASQKRGGAGADGNRCF